MALDKTKGNIKSREVISLHIGQAGTQIGSKCWELYCLEHGLSPDGMMTLSEDMKCPFFFEKETGKFIPRSILVDTEPTVMDAYRRGKHKGLFPADQLISGRDDASNCFARGKYTVGPKVLGKVVEQIRILAEGCQNIQGFMIFHAFGGGTGSGLTSLILEHLQETFPKKLKFLFSVFPAAQIASAVVDPYNAVLMTRNSSAFADCTMMVENQAIFELLSRKLNLSRPHLEQLNLAIAQLASSLTASMRFSGVLNVDLNEYCTNLVPFPRLRYTISAHSPFGPKEKHGNVDVITADCFETANQLFPCNPNTGKYISCCLLYRGDVVPTEATAATVAIRSEPNVKFVDWVPTNFKMGITSRAATVTPGSGMAQARRSVTMIANNTAVAAAWDILAQKFDKLLNKKAFLHWYTSEGMELEEMKEARFDLSVLENDYWEIENYAADL